MRKEAIEGRFFETLLGLNYVKGKKREELVNEAKSYASQLPEYAQWPNDSKQFWNAEAICWTNRLDSNVREAIRKELSFLQGSNLDLGSGSYSYVKNSVVADFAEEMLLVNDAKQKLVVDLEKKLPLSDHLFDSVTMVFVASYVKNLSNLFIEAKRVLKIGGKLVIFQSADPVMDIHGMHYKNNYGDSELKILLKQAGLKVRSFNRKLAGKEFLMLVGEKGVQ
jgi:SAM-dependent methyltransferase